MLACLGLCKGVIPLVVGVVIILFTLECCMNYSLFAVDVCVIIVCIYVVKYVRYMSDELHNVSFLSFAKCELEYEFYLS